MSTVENNTADSYPGVVDRFYDFLDKASKDAGSDKLQQQVLSDFRNRMVTEMQKHPTLWAKIWSGNPELFKEASQQYVDRFVELTRDYSQYMQELVEYYNSDEKTTTAYQELQKRLSAKFKREVVGIVSEEENNNNSSENNPGNPSTT